MNFIKLIKGFFHNSRNAVNDEVYGQNLSDVQLQHNLSDSHLIDDTLLSNDVSIERQNALPLPEAATDEKKTDDLKSIIIELENEIKEETCNQVVIHDKVQDERNESRPCVNSLLDDAAYMALATKCCEIISELDSLQTKANDDMTDLVKARIKEALLYSGADPISDETSFDILRHKAEEKSIVRKGTLISSTIEPGIAIGDKVMIKAKVKIKKND